MRLFTRNIALKKQCEYRHGVLHAMERRMFPSLPPMATPSEMQTFRESDYFKAGEEFGKTCFLAYKNIEVEVSEYENDDQWRLPAIAAAGLCIFGMALLWVVSLP